MKRAKKNGKNIKQSVNVKCKKNNGIVKKKIRKVMTLIEKGSILDSLDANEPVMSIARRYGINESSVRTIRHNRERIRNSLKSSSPQCAKTVSYTRNAPLEKVEKMLAVWIEDQNRKQLPVSASIIKSKALKLYETVTEQIEENSKLFHASKGWFENFKRRHSLHNLSIKGGNTAWCDEETKVNYYLEEFQNIITEDNYKPEQVFNCAETSLYWKKMPQKSFLGNEETAAKDRLTLLLCSNASGDFICKPLLVYKSLNPRKLSNKNKDGLPVYWRANTGAWITTDIFIDWFQNCFLPQVANYLESKNLPFKVLLIIDNLLGQRLGYLSELSTDIRIEFLPANTKTLLLPLDQEIMTTFKAYYTRRILEKFFDAIERNPTGTLIQHWKKYSLMNCIINIKESIDELNMNILNSGWRKLWPQIVVHNNENIVLEEKEKIISIVKQLPGTDSENFQLEDVEEFLESHNSQSLTEEELLDMIENETETSDDSDVDETDTLTARTINKCLKIARDLTDLIIKKDPIMERSLKAAQGIMQAMAPYEEVLQTLSPHAKQSNITGYFTKIEL